LAPSAVECSSHATTHHKNFAPKVLKPLGFFFPHFVPFVFLFISDNIYAKYLYCVIYKQENILLFCRQIAHQMGSLRPDQAAHSRSPCRPCKPLFGFLVIVAFVGLIAGILGSSLADAEKIFLGCLGLFLNHRKKERRYSV
jgi:hypothetical protein